MFWRCAAALGLTLAASCTAPAPARESARSAASPSAAGAVSASPPPGQSRAASAAELAIVQGLMHETEQLRGLAFLAPVDVRIEDRVAMRGYVDRALDDAQLARAKRRYLALGALDAELDVRALLVSVMEEELVGYYDPKQKRLAVRSDIARELGMASTETLRSPARPARASTERSLTWRATVVHELVHALQDQHFALGDTIEQARTTDADNAFGALVEGDATLVMLGYTAQLAGESLDALAEHPERVLSAMSRTPEQLTGALRRAPALLREPLLFRYREGAHFCAELYRDGGWARVNEAQRKPPASTLSVRNPRRYLEHAPEPTLALPPVAWLHERGYARLDEDVLGGLELSVVLGTAGVEAEYIVNAWRGDRYLVLEHDGQLASLWWLRFASASTARNVAAAFVQLGDPLRRVAQKASSLLVARGLDERTFALAVGTLAAVGRAASGHSSLARPRARFDTRARSARTAARSALARGGNRGDPLATNTHQH